MTSYLLELKIVSDDSKLVDLYEQAVVRMQSEEYKNNPHKDSGFDVYIPKGNVDIYPGHTKLVDMKIQCAAYKIVCDGETCVRQPTAFFMYPRSSIYKSLVRLANNTGIIDSGYRGNLMGAFDNNNNCFALDKIWSQKEETYGRLLQICMPDLSPFSVKIVDSLNDTTRGGGGFGSTGK